jgi:HSP20 family molecular chaperone IbpA
MPAIDMYEDQNDLVIEIDLPGFRKEDINIRIMDRNNYQLRQQESEQQKNKNPYNAYTLDKKIVLPSPLTMLKG